MPPSAADTAMTVAHLSTLRGYTLEDLDKMLDRRPAHSAPVSPRVDPAAGPPNATAPAAAAPLPDESEMIAMRRALKRVEEEAAKGVRLDPRQALEAELDALRSSGGTSAAALPPKPAHAGTAPPLPEPTGPPAATGAPDVTDVTDAPAAPAASAAPAAPALPALPAAPPPPEEPLVIVPDDEPRLGPKHNAAALPSDKHVGGSRARSRLGWLPRSFRGAAHPASKAGQTEGSTSADAEPDIDERSMPLAAYDGAAPDENDWAYALRWTAPSGVGAATVLAAMQAAADSDGIEPGAASDGQQHPHAQRRTPSLGDASALAAAARRAVSYRGKVAPEAANSAAEPQAGVESAVTAAVATAATGATAGTAAGAAAASSPPPGAAGAASTTSRRGFHRRSVST